VLMNEEKIIQIIAESFNFNVFNFKIEPCGDKKFYIIQLDDSLNLHSSIFIEEIGFNYTVKQLLIELTSCDPRCDIVKIDDERMDKLMTYTLLNFCTDNQLFI